MQSFQWKKFFWINQAFCILPLTELRKSVSVATAGFINSSRHILSLFLLCSHEISSKREILVDVVGKKGCIKRMFTLTRARRYRGLYEIVLAKIQRKCKSSSSWWKFKLSGSWVIWSALIAHSILMKFCPNEQNLVESILKSKFPWR